MELREYIDNFIADVQTDADSLNISLEEAFLTNIADKLVDSEIISRYEVGYFQKTGRQNRKIEINGYSYEEADGTYNLFIIDDLKEPNSSLTQTMIESLIRKVEEIVYVGIENKYQFWEESSPGYEVAEQIKTFYQNREKLDNGLDLKKIRIFIFTNKELSKRFKNEKRKPIYEIPVEYSVYDATRLFDMAKTGFAKEPVDIVLNNYGIKGIYAIKSTERNGEFISYLATISGEVLASIYLENGTQILEGNVRAFLSVRGKVNKGIRKTILENPEKFFLLNNGITVTSNGIKTVKTSEGILITEINDLQIVNGGQTTASLANSVLKDKADLSKIQVMMKLSVLESSEVSEKLVPEISRASNSQNKVDEADFFSNHPFHIKIQELSERNLAPAVDGNQYQTTWFYERARGQYTVQQMKLSSSQTKSWLLKHPKSQVLKKTDIAKYYMAYEGFPHEASKGAQAVMKKFAGVIEGKGEEDGFWATKSSEVNASYFKNIVAKAILFKETEKLVSNQEWYKEIKAYRANIVVYSVAVLSNFATDNKLSIDLNKIWNRQHIYSALTSQLIVTTKEVYEFLTRDDRTTLNVTEWAKKEEAWKRAKKNSWTILDTFKETLLSLKEGGKESIKESTIDAMTFVGEHNLYFWVDLLKWGKKYLYIDYKDEEFLKLAISLHQTGKYLSDKQYNAIVSVYNNLVSKGYEAKSVEDYDNQFDYI